VVHHGPASGGDFLVRVAFAPCDDLRRRLDHAAGPRRSLRCGDANPVDHLCVHDVIGAFRCANRNCHVEIRPIAKKRRSVLDLLQTLPTFVYLIPLIFLFSVTESKLYGIAIILYAIVPVIRLTDLGIRLVDRDVIEAANAFGMTDRQKLLRVQLPLALPNIMAGINQTIMMSLAMVVIASLVSAPGLGVNVLRGIRNLELGVGIVAGIGIVLLAVILDRVSKAALARVDKTQVKH